MSNDKKNKKPFNLDRDFFNGEMSNLFSSIFPTSDKIIFGPYKNDDNGTWKERRLNLDPIFNSCSCKKTNSEKFVLVKNGSIGRYVIEIDVPGFGKEDISVDFKPNSNYGQFNIKGSIGQRTFNRTIELPFDIVKNDIVAQAKNGLLSIFVTKENNEKIYSLNINIV